MNSVTCCPACSVLLRGKHAAAGLGCCASGGRASVLVLKADLRPCEARCGATCFGRVTRPRLGRSSSSSTERGRMLLMVCSLSAGEAVAAREEPSRSFDVFSCGVAAALDTLRLPASCLAVPALPGAQPRLDQRTVKQQVPLITALLLWSVVPDATVVAVLAVGCTLAAASLPRHWWQPERQALENQDGHGETYDQARYSQPVVHPKLELTDMASLGVFTFNFDPLLAKMGLVAVGCLLLVGLFHAGYSGVGTPFGHSVRRRVIKAQRQGDFRDRLRKRLGERESGFRVTYQQALPNSYFTGTRQAAVPEELFDGVHGARNIMTRSESDKLRKAKAGAEGSHRSSPVARHTTSHREHSVHPDYHNASPLTTLDDQMITQPGAAQFQVDRPSRNVSAATKERRSIAPSPASPTNVRAVSSAVGENKPTKVPLEEIEYMRASARSGIVGKWQEKDELELKARVEELRRKVLAAENNRHAAMRSLAEEKKRSLELEVKICRQKESAMALEEEVRVLKESHEALLTSLRKKYSSSVAARAAAALLYQNWDTSADDTNLREMVH